MVLPFPIPNNDNLFLYSSYESLSSPSSDTYSFMNPFGRKINARLQSTLFLLQVILLLFLLVFYRTQYDYLSANTAPDLDGPSPYSSQAGTSSSDTSPP